MPTTSRNPKPHINICMAGNPGVGKTTLAAAIAKVQALKGLIPPDTQQSINLGQTTTCQHFEIETEKRRYNVTDIPGHQDYLTDMIAGTSVMDCAIIVIDPEEDDRQALHIQLRILVTIPYIFSVVVYINQKDEHFDAELMEVVQLEVRDFLEANEHDPAAPIISGSALAALASNSNDFNAPEYRSISDLLRAVDEWFPQPERLVDKPFLMAIDTVKTQLDSEVIVEGVVNRGRVTRNDTLDLLGFRDQPQIVTVSAIESFGKPLNDGFIAERITLYLSDIDKNNVQIGMVLAEKDRNSIGRRFRAYAAFFYTFESGWDRPISDGFQAEFHLWCGEITGTITLIEDKTQFLPGDVGQFDVELIHPVMLEKSGKFIIRKDDFTIAWSGIITEVL